MANTDYPHGLFPVAHMVGATPEIEWFSKVVGYGTAIFMYDAVHQVADGSIEPGASATPGTTLWSGVALTYGAASTATTHAVCVDPLTIFEAQDNDDTDGFAAADAGLNVNIEANAGSAATKISGHELDESTINTTNTLDLHLRRLLVVPNNEYGEFSRWEVQFNKHRRAANSAGV